ncbi:MAG: helix-turn-helix domain-containing protein, partial [Verrucomicrobiota bacterium]
FMNRLFQIFFANRYFYERLGFANEAEIVGKDDFELFPKPLATKFRNDDERVLKTGEEMSYMVELFLSRQGLPDWFVTNKLPVIGKNGRPAGVMGTVQRFNQSQGLDSPDKVVANAVERMLKQPEAIDSISQLTKELGISHRHFDRRFKDVTGLTPKQFLGRSRIQRACQLLQETRDSVGEIALDLGYCDQSAFTAQFRRRMGLTPQRYRREFGPGNATAQT